MNRLMRASRVQRSTTRRSASRISIPTAPIPFPIIDDCPPPTCPCRRVQTPLDIERKQSLHGSMAAYAEHVLVSTGQHDWTSRIENDGENALASLLKNAMGSKGKFSDPYHNVLITNSSLANTSSDFASPQQNRDATPPKTTSAFILPSFKYVPCIPMTAVGVHDFIQAFLLPTELHKAHNGLSQGQQNLLLRDPSKQREFPGVRDMMEILVLICGHAQRDERCGVMGPILKKEFEEKLQQQNILLASETWPSDVNLRQSDSNKPASTLARVALISHIGGHKWAGNVIIYIPPQLTNNALAGKGIWYGRVGPEHVEGIVSATIIGGKVVKDMFRGAIDQNEGIIRL